MNREVAFRFDRDSIVQEYEDARKFREICLSLIQVENVD